MHARVSSEPLPCADPCFISRMHPPIRNGHVGDWRLSDADFLASFRLPGAADKHDKLKELNPLPRDGRILFDEERHEYWIDGRVRVPRSVTGLVHAYNSEFDPYAAVRAMKNSTRWPEKREAFLNDVGKELEDSEIVELWARRGRIASARGTLLHYHAEMHLNGREIEPPHSPEFAMLLAMVRALKEHFGLCPYRTEISLFHAGLCLAGQADALFVDEHGAITILDWKRTQRISWENAFRTLKEPINHLPDCNGWAYGLQLNVYKYPAVALMDAEPNCYHRWVHARNRELLACERDVSRASPSLAAESQTHSSSVHEGRARSDSGRPDRSRRSRERSTAGHRCAVCFARPNKLARATPTYAHISLSVLVCAIVRARTPPSHCCAALRARLERWFLQVASF